MNSPKKKSNSGIISNQDKQRKDTLLLIERTLQEMHQKHLPINKQTLALEAGLSRQALYAPYIKTYLESHPFFNPSANNDDEHPAQTIAHLQIELETQKKKICSLQKELNKTKQLFKESKQSYAELNREYQKLLGRYQTDVGRKLIHI